VRTYFLDAGAADLELSREHKLLLVARVLQSKTWRMVCNELGIIPPEAMKKVREATRVISQYFLDVKSESDAEKYLYLRLTAHHRPRRLRRS